MKVVVWKSHGDIEVYASDTVEQIEYVLDVVMEILEQIGLTHLSLSCRNHLKNHPGDFKQAEKVLKNIFYDVIGSYDEFEDIFITEVRNS